MPLPFLLRDSFELLQIEAITIAPILELLY